ncbi:hypothetical protein [Pedobacter panaciterrae]
MRPLKKLLSAVFITLSIPALGQAQKQADSITVAIAPEYNSVSGFHRFWLGESYRKIWATPVKVRIIDLQKEKGGLKIVKLGGDANPLFTVSRSDGQRVRFKNDTEVSGTGLA